MAERDIVVPELDAGGRITAGSVIEQIEEIAAEAAPPLDVSGGHDGAVAIGGAYSPAPEDAPGARVYGALGIAIGALAEAGGSSVAIGGPASGAGSVSVGATTEGSMATAVGGGGGALGAGATSLGYSAVARGARSVALGMNAAAENDYDFVLGTEDHNVKVPGTLSVQPPEEPQHAATREYVDYVAAGGGTWVSGIRFTQPATLSNQDYVKLWLANPGGISLIEVAVELPAGSAGEEYEFTMNQGDLSARETQALKYLGGQGASILPGIDNVSKEARPVVFSLSGNAFLTSHLDHGGITVYGTVLIPSFGVLGEGAEAE